MITVVHQLCQDRIENWAVGWGLLEIYSNLHETFIRIFLAFSSEVWFFFFFSFVKCLSFRTIETFFWSRKSLGTSLFRSFCDHGMRHCSIYSLVFIPWTELIIWGHSILLMVLHLQVDILNSAQHNGSKQAVNSIWKINIICNFNGAGKLKGLLKVS